MIGHILRTLELITRPPRLGHDTDDVVVDGAEQLAQLEETEEVSEPQCQLLAALDCDCPTCVEAVAAIPPLEEDPVAMRLGIVPDVLGVTEPPLSSDDPNRDDVVALLAQISYLVEDLRNLVASLIVPATDHLAGSSPAEVSGVQPLRRPPPGTSLGAERAAPVIRAVLAEHHYPPRGGCCECGETDDAVTDGDWREHVAPLIADRLGFTPK